MPEHDEAHRQRCRHEQAERSPQPRPEGQGHEQRDLGDSRRTRIEDGFEHEIREQLEHDEQAHHPERTGPAREGGKAHQDRRTGADHGSDVGDEPECRTERRPDQRVRHAEDVKPEPGGDAVDQIDQGLHQQLPADTGSRLIERLRRDCQLAVAEQPNQPIAQIPAFEQHEDHHRQHEPGGPHGADDRTKPREARETRDRLGGDHNGPRGRSCRRARLSKIGLDAFDRLLKLLDRSSLSLLRGRPRSSPGY